MAGKHWINRVLNRFGYTISRDRPSSRAHVPAEFWTLHERHRRNTGLRWESLYDAYRAVNYVAGHNIPGAIVECGVWRGGCSILMAETAQMAGECSREIFMFDTFEGMPDAGDLDVSSTGGAATGKAHEYRVKGAGWKVASIDDVSANVEQSSYPLERFKLIPGMVEDTVPAHAPEQIAVLRLDTDFYESTKHELIHLYPRLAPGGILLIDDYGRWLGARVAVDDFFAQRAEKAFLFQNATTGVVTVAKPF